MYEKEKVVAEPEEKKESEQEGKDHRDQLVQ
jgi:L-lactate utilization protein LutC